MTRVWWVAAVIVALATLAVSVAIYPQLGDRVPIHWNFKGEIDGYGPKTWAAFLLPLGMLGALGLAGGLAVHHAEVAIDRAVPQNLCVHRVFGDGADGVYPRAGAERSVGLCA